MSDNHLVSGVRKAWRLTALDEARARAIIMPARHKPTPSQQRRNLLRLLTPWPMASVLFFG